MKPGQPEREKDFRQDLKRFEQLPAKARALDLLQDQAEKATGKESVVLNELIRDKAR